MTGVQTCALPIFIVYNDGSVKATRGTFDGVWIGDIEVGNIKISDPSKDTGNDAVLTIQNGANGIKRVELTDTGDSYFRQDLVVKDNYDNEVISLNQDGMIKSSSLNIGTSSTNTIIQNNNVTINGLSIDSSGSVARLSGKSIDFGSATTEIGRAHV